MRSYPPIISATHLTMHSRIDIPKTAAGEPEMAVYRSRGIDEPQDIDYCGPDRAAHAA